MKKATGNRYFLLFILFTIGSFAMYWRAKAGVFTFDALDWVRPFDALGIKGFLVNFRDISFRPFLLFITYFGYAIFGLNEIVALLFCVLLHALNATMIVWFIHRMVPQRDQLLGILAGLIFLFFPYQTEVVVWGVGNLYAITLALFWGMLWSVIQYSETRLTKFLYIHVVFFAFAIFTHELAFVFPFAVFFLVLLLFPVARWKALLRLEVLMILSFLPLYFVINKIVLGVWIGHYGIDKHTQIHVQQIVVTYISYWCKFLLFTNWWEPHWRDACYQFIEQHVLRSAALLIVVGGLWLWFARKSSTLKLSVFLFITFTGLVIPVLNLYFIPWIPIHGDRLGYLPSLFFIAAVLVALYSIHRYVALGYGLLWWMSSLFFLNENIKNWQAAGEVMHQLESTFPEAGTRPIFILAEADNFKGAYMYRCRLDFPFTEVMRIKHKRDYTAQTKEVYGFNMQSKADKVNVLVVDSNTLKVEFEQWGNWWWKAQAGATNLDNALYSTTIDEWNHSYLIRFKQKPKNALYLYQSGMVWKEVENF
ncbi:MAG: glycosyltransferase family 39 protein [Chitinophagales bacterium]|nr:glycosyltransferase family 39 protein [Chitinophagales bacterium]